MRGPLACLLLVVTGADGLVVYPPAASARAHWPGAKYSAKADVLVMQVDAPVKIPDTIPPELAPTKPASDKENQKGKKFKLLLFNDNVNRREYVARILVQNIPEMSQADAYLVMQKAHKQGMAVVGVWVFEIAEAYCDSLKAGGLIASVTEDE